MLTGNIRQRTAIAPAANAYMHMSGKKKAAKANKAKAPRAAKGPKPIGIVTHFYGHISVAIVKFNKKVSVGTALTFKGATTDFKDVAKSMQLDHEAIPVAPKGKEVGVKVKKQVREGDRVYPVGE